MLTVLFCGLIIVQAQEKKSGDEGKVNVGYGAGKNIQTYPFINKYDSTHSDSARLNQCFEANNFNGKRSKAEILRVIFKNLPNIKRVYNKRLKDAPDLKGYMFIKFQIVSSGKIIKTEVCKTSITDSLLQLEIGSNIMTWEFAKLSEINDTTEAVYPFVFSH
jgi:hypothetical protein